jgi:hypothetical protein
MRSNTSAPRVDSVPDPIGKLLETVIEELRGLRADIARRVRPDRLTRADRARLARILPAVGGVFGSELFAVRELLTNPAPALRVALDGENAKALGRLFYRAAGTTCDRYAIRAEGRELNVTLWRVPQVDDGFLE